MSDDLNDLNGLAAREADSTPPGRTPPGRKDDAGKRRYDLVPPVALAAVADVLTFGAEKYDPENWRRVPDAPRRYLAAIMRHVEAYRAGERLDPESGLHHLAHAVTCALFVITLEDAE
jgi:hypothetical protein